jgi:hypothetical protein
MVREFGRRKMEKGITADHVVDRVRGFSSAADDRKIDRETEGRVERFAGKSRGEITRRIGELDREWDMEKILGTNASVLVLAGLSAYAGSKNRKWLFIPGVVLPFLMQHALQGWCPPLPVFRRLGVRTRKEIEREKYALKVLRGDFDEISSRGDVSEEVGKLLDAVRR